ncbi:DUF523 and DUF1722 domain-containing protein [Halobacillus sp. Nhm2S1]|uniref:YbgA family protein n=1 Tax=Halobacillus sp. Nhm2S1 TaxID=2866716 RepID=UPI001C735B90|nr:DUF523 and DUF1722 domain-containing protein [Halobacillus sp. Nhm2S1]MBX0357937.1 DUF523 and DUF1722 domain-containing protein [Halobacillus sp. Nhm2S1]
MRHFPTPKVVVSRCLEFAEVRYNGAVIPDKAVQRMQSHVEFIPVCPEVEIGLGVPRDVIRIVDGEEEQLVQPKTGENLTDTMREFSKGFLDHLDDVDGFLLKNRSPTCGMHDVKVYHSEGNSQVVGKTSGLFAQEILHRHGGLAIEEEGRLKNFTLRHHFLTKLFTLADFREVKKEAGMNGLQQFHARNKYLFMAYHPGTLKKLGQTVANHDHLDYEHVIENYEPLLHQLLERPAKPTAHVNVCQHIAGYFKKELSKEEKENFQSLLEQYKEEKVPLSAVLSVLNCWVARFQSEYLSQQTYFEPYPLELVEISDSGKGRAYS